MYGFYLFSLKYKNLDYADRYATREFFTHFEREKTLSFTRMLIHFSSIFETNCCFK